MLQAMTGVYAKEVHVRMACLNAVKCIPAVSSCSIPQNVEIATSIWLVLHDPEKVEHSYAYFPSTVLVSICFSFGVFLIISAIFQLFTLSCS